MGLNEILFYGGIIMSVITLLAAIIFFVIFYMSKVKLDLKFDKEYGEIKKIKKS